MSRLCAWMSRRRAGMRSWNPRVGHWCSRHRHRPRGNTPHRRPHGIERRSSRVSRWPRRPGPRRPRHRGPEPRSSRAKPRTRRVRRRRRAGRRPHRHTPEQPSPTGAIANTDEQKQQQDHQKPTPPIAKKAPRHLPVKDSLHVHPRFAAIRHGRLQQLLSPKVIMWLSFHYFFGSIRFMIVFNCRLASFKCHRLVPSLIDSMAAISRWA